MLVLFGFLLYGLSVVPQTLLASLVTLAVYELNKVTDHAEDSIDKPDSVPNSTTKYLMLSIVSMVGGFLIGLWCGVFVFVVLIMPIVFGFVYSVKFVHFLPRFKEVVGVKNVVVAGSWAVTGCLLPIAVHSVAEPIILVMFVYVFVRVFVAEVLRDVIDVKGDYASGIKTVPIKLGLPKTKMMLLGINSIGVLPVLYSFATGLFLRFVPVLLFGVVYGYFAIWLFFKPNLSRIAIGVLDADWIPVVVLILFIVVGVL